VTGVNVRPVPVGLPKVRAAPLLLVAITVSVRVIVDGPAYGESTADVIDTASIIAEAEKTWDAPFSSITVPLIVMVAI